MTTRNLEALFEPQSIALVGASARPNSVGQLTARNLLGAGFAGPVMMVNPHETEIEGRPAYAAIQDLPQPPDLAVVATPAAIIPGLVADLGAAGCRAAIVLSAGFEAPGEEAALRQAVLAAARPHLLRIMGPNCLGLLSPAGHINASFAHRMPEPGGLALVSQSGAVAAAALDWGPAHGLGFSHVITVGDSADVDVGDLLDYLATDATTRGVLLYLEGLSDARKFMSAARAAARSKPVAVLKAGRTMAGATAAFSHTGALAGADAVYDAALRRAGVIRVDTLEALLDAGLVFDAGLRASGARLAILTNGGGAGVLATDALERSDAQLAALSPTTQAALKAVSPPHGSCRNPVDILGDASPRLYGQAMKVLLEAPEVDAILALNCPVAVADSTEAARSVADAARAAKRRPPVLSAWLGGSTAEPGRKTLAAAGIPTFGTPEGAVGAFEQLVRARAAQELLLEAPAAVMETVDKVAARTIIDDALSQGRTVLTDPEARAILRAYRVPVVQSLSAETPQSAGAAAARLRGKVVLKILSRDISHKSDVGGVRLGLVGAAEVELAAREMLSKIQSMRPNANIDGFVIEPLIERPTAEEMLAGVVQDPTFGPVVMVGHGGVAVQVLADRAVGLPPLNGPLADDMIARTRVSKLLAGYRDRKPADRTALARVLVALGDLACDLPEISELDINPLLCDAAGVLAVDARIGLRARGATTARPAIMPYPAELERKIVIGGETLQVRAIRPQDAQGLMDMVDRSEPADVHFRFGGGMRHLSPDLARRLSHIDYDRQIALVALDPLDAIVGVVRLVRDPDCETGEFALMVRSDHQNRGIGWRLLQLIVEHARGLRLATLWGDVARDNSRLRALATSQGFVALPSSDPNRIRLTLSLRGAPEIIPAELGHRSGSQLGVEP